MHTSMNCANRSKGMAVCLGGLFLIICFLASVFAANSAVSTDALVDALLGNEADASAALILYQVRIPRALAAVFCGSGLAVSGLLLQSGLGNALAAPGVMGVNAGAGLFVLLAGILFPLSAAGREGMAFAGALIATLIVYLISRKAGLSRSTLILSGVAVSSLMTAGINAIITIRPEAVADKVAFNLGGLQNVSVRQLIFAVPVIILGLIVALLLSGGIDLFALGDETAHGLGLNVRLYRFLTIICAAVLAAAAVSVCGLLGFVGLIIPNLIRMRVPGSCRYQIIMCTLWGSGFLLLCDTLSRLLFFPYELPAGLLLSFLGAPFFIYMLTRRKRRLNL